MKAYIVKMTDGSEQRVNAEICTYDQVGNLLFANERKIKAPQAAPNAQAEVTIVKVINLRSFIEYYPAEIQ